MLSCECGLASVRSSKCLDPCDRPHRGLDGDEDNVEWGGDGAGRKAD